MTTPAADLGSKTKIVLAVDDVRENLMMLKALLSAAGYQFFGVSSGPECLEIVRRAPPRLILLDIQMPDMDGFETCRRLRTFPEIRAVPIAFLTARKSREDVEAGLAAGGNDFIVKPFDTVKLLERVRHWVSRRIDPMKGGTGA